MITLTPKFIMLMASDLSEKEKIKVIEECKYEFYNHPFIRLLKLFDWKRKI